MGFSTIWREMGAAAQKVFAKPSYRKLSVVSFFFVGAVAWLLPVFIIPGNSIDFWFQIASWWSYALLILFSGLMAVLIPMQAYLFAQRMSAAKKGVGLASLVPAFASTMFSSAACAGCIATFGAFLGGGAALFLINNRFEFIALGAVFTLASIYHSSKTINGHCSDCAIPVAGVKSVV